MRRKLVAVGTQTTEVQNSVQAVRASGGSERVRRFTIGFGELVGRTHRMDQVVGCIAPVDRGIYRSGIRNVAFDDLNGVIKSARKPPGRAPCTGPGAPLQRDAERGVRRYSP